MTQQMVDPPTPGRSAGGLSRSGEPPRPVAVPDRPVRAVGDPDYHWQIRAELLMEATRVQAERDDLRRQVLRAHAELAESDAARDLAQHQVRVLYGEIESLRAHVTTLQAQLTQSTVDPARFAPREELDQLTADLNRARTSLSAPSVVLIRSWEYRLRGFRPLHRLLRSAVRSAARKANMKDAT